MPKVVYNGCYGGFSLSKAAVQLGRRLSGDPTWGTYQGSLARHDPTLVQVVEQLGTAANGSCAKLQVATISGTAYRITDYDGAEEVETPETINWTVIVGQEN